MVTKAGNRREARQYAFKCYMLMNFIVIKMMFNFLKVIFKKLWIKHMPMSIIQGVIATAEKK